MNKSNLISSSALVDIINLPSNPAKKIIVDYTDEMHEKVIELTSSDVSCRDIAILKTVSNEMNSRSTTWKGMSDTKVKTLVFNTRSRENSEDIFRLVESPSLYMVHNSNFFYNLIKPYLITRQKSRKDYGLRKSFPF